MDLSLAILPYLFNNNNQFDKTYFISKLLNNKVFNAICVYYRDANFASRISFNSSGIKVKINIEIELINRFWFIEI